MSQFDTSRTSRDVQLESAKWAKTDIDQVAVRDFMSTAVDQSTGSCAAVCIPHEVGRWDAESHYGRADAPAVPLVAVRSPRVRWVEVQPGQGGEFPRARAGAAASENRPTPSAFGQVGH